MKLFDLHGKTAIITGAAQGLARGMAEGLMEAGATVCIMDISKKAQDVSKSFNQLGYSCDYVEVDLGDRSALEKGFYNAIEKLGGHLDIIVNAAGIQRRHFCEDFPIEDWDAVINVNLSSVFLLCQLAGKQYIKQNTGGKIINIASMLSYFGGFTVPAYAASKGGVAQLTKALSNEWASKNIGVNAIAPGYMDTPMNVALVNDEIRNAQILSRIPKNRWGTPEDMKGTIIFLASNASDYLSGAIIPVDGGFMSR